MTKPIDPAFLALKRCVLALEDSPPEMIRPTLEFLWDKYVRPSKSALKERPGGAAMICGHTGQVDRFCSNCGTRLRWECQMRQTTGTNMTGCGRTNKFPDDKFCGGCGSARPEWVQE